MDNTELTEQLFKAIDAIVTERIRQIPYDKTVIGTIIENNDAEYGKYKVTTDNNITFDAYSDNISYNISDRIYIRIPENDYTKQKIITGKYVPDFAMIKITNSEQQQINDLKNIVINLQNQINKLLGEKGE